MNAPSQQQTRDNISQGRSTSRAPILGPHTVDAAFEDQSFITPTNGKDRPLMGNFAKQLTALKEQEARLRELLRTSRKR